MERQYEALYRLGVTPWDGAALPHALTGLVEGAHRLRPGVALDISCGTGRPAAYLAGHGWSVHGFDVSATAIARARRREPRVDWQVADLVDYAASESFGRLVGRVCLIVDLGCLHGLDPSRRRTWAGLVAAAAGPSTHIVVGAAPPRRRPFLPRGISGRDLESLLGDGWTAARHRHRDGTYVFGRGSSPAASTS